MDERPSPYQHVIRVAFLFAGGFLAFAIIRWSLVPADFGQYGFYRGGALVEARGLPLKYGGEAVCVDCHSDVADVRKGSRHERLKCETCHGPLWAHAEQLENSTPPALNPRTLCFSCHTQLRGVPAQYPQILPADHGGDGPCTECHKPHRPKIDDRP